MATTLSSLTTLAQQRADMINSSFVASSEWTSYINDSYAELYGLIVQKFGDDYLVSSTTYVITTDGQNSLFSLSGVTGGLFKLIGVEVQYTNNPNQWISVPQFMFSERNGISPMLQGNYAGYALRYRLLGLNLMLVTPAGQIPPPAGYKVQLWYVPQANVLVNGSDTISAAIDGFGWASAYISVDSAIKALIKEESDVSALVNEKNGLIRRIESEAANRNAADPQRVPDAMGLGSTWWGNDWGGMW